MNMSISTESIINGEITADTELLWLTCANLDPSEEFGKEVGDADTLGNRNKIEDMELELKEVKEELKDMKKELKDMKELEGELKDMKKELKDMKELEGELKDMKKELKDMKELEDELKDMKKELKDMKELEGELKDMKKELKDMKELEDELKDMKKELKDMKELEVELKDKKLELENKELRAELAHHKQLLNACKCMTIGEMLDLHKLKQQQNQKEEIGNSPDFVWGCRAKTDELERKKKADQNEHRAKIDEKTMEAKVGAEFGHQKLLEDHKALHAKMDEYQNKQQQKQEETEKLKNLMEEMKLKQQQHQKEINDKIGWLNEDQQKLVSIDQFCQVQTTISDLKQEQKDDQEERMRLKSVQAMGVSELRQQDIELQSDQKALLDKLNGS